EGGEILRKHLSRAASDLADYFIKHARDGFEVHGTPHDMATVMSALRPMGMEAVRVIFGQEMERVLRKMVESGKTATISGRGGGGGGGGVGAAGGPPRRATKTGPRARARRSTAPPWRARCRRRPRGRRSLRRRPTRSPCLGRRRPRCARGRSRIRRAATRSG